MCFIVKVLSLTGEWRASRRFDQPKRLLLLCPQSIGASLIDMQLSSVVTIASEPVSIDYDRSFEKNRDVDVDSMLHGHVD